MCRTHGVHPAVRYVSFKVTNKVAQLIREAAEAKRGRNVRRPGDAHRVHLEECAVWLDENYKAVRPFYLPDMPSIVTVHNDGSFALMQWFHPCMAVSMRASVDELQVGMEEPQSQPKVMVEAQAELQL